MNSSRQYPRKPTLATLLLASVGALPIAPAYSHLMHIHSYPMKHTPTLHVARSLSKSAWQAVLLRSALTTLLLAPQAVLHAADVPKPVRFDRFYVNS